MTAVGQYLILVKLKQKKIVVKNVKLNAILKVFDTKYISVQGLSYELKYS